MDRCGAILWSMINLLLKKICLPQQPLTAIVSSASSETYRPLPSPCWNVDWLDLVQAAKSSVKSCMEQV